MTETFEMRVGDRVFEVRIDQGRCAIREATRRDVVMITDVETLNALLLEGPLAEEGSHRPPDRGARQPEELGPVGQGLFVSPWAAWEPEAARCSHQMDPAVEVWVLEARTRHPDWGPRRLVHEASRAAVDPLPSRSGVYRALKRAGLIDPLARRRRDRRFKRWERGGAMDHCGMGRSSSADTRVSALPSARIV